MPNIMQGQLPKISRISKSRDGWKTKAKRRGAKVREARKRAEANRKKRAADKQEMRRLREKVAALSKSLEVQGLLPAPPGAGLETRTLCVLVVVCCIVSFRSVPRILRLFNPLLGAAVRVPHFSSVINWTLRVGVAVFNGVGRLLDYPWVAIMDCSITIGTRKALVVLRIPLNIFQSKQEAIKLKDCECIGLELAPSWNGELVSQALGRFFDRAGTPAAIIKDGGTDLTKGVALYCRQNPQRQIHAIDDVGHYAANSLKARFAEANPFKRFIAILSKGAARIRQTNLAWLLPPKIRSKARFQSITEVAEWARKMLALLARRGRAKEGSDLGKARAAFADLSQLRSFLAHFCYVCSVTERFLKLMKTNGLNQTTYRKAKAVLSKLPQNSSVRSRLSAWLERHIRIQRLLNIGNLPLPVSSDIIESLFGTFKTIIQRNPQAELNRLIYVLPLLCGDLSPNRIDQALKDCSHSQMLQYIEQHVPPTLRQQRLRTLRNNLPPVPKTGAFPSLESG